MKNKTYPVTYMSMVEFHKDLGKLNADYDAEASILAPQFSYVTKDGQAHFCNSLTNYLNSLKSDMNIPVMVEGTYITRVVTVNYSEDISALKNKDESKKELSEVKKPVAAKKTSIKKTA